MSTKRSLSSLIDIHYQTKDIKCNYYFFKIRDHNYIEKILEFSGLSKQQPLVALSLAIIMLSMAGIPPFAGFFGKFYIFIAALKADLILLAVLGVLSSVISAFYYLRIIKVMYFDENESFNTQLIMSSKSKLILLVSMIFISLFIFYPSFLTSISTNIAIEYLQ